MAPILEDSHNCCCVADCHGLPFHAKIGIAQPVFIDRGATTVPKRWAESNRAMDVSMTVSNDRANAWARPQSMATLTVYGQPVRNLKPHRRALPGVVVLALARAWSQARRVPGGLLRHVRTPTDQRCGRSRAAS